MRKQAIIGSAAVWVVMLSLMSAGCEESVDPVLGTDKAFTFYGYFNPRSDTQAVRVFSIDGILEPSPTRPLDAIVTSTNKETGEVRLWRDSIITFRDRSVGHVFYSFFRPDHGARFTLEAMRSDGKKTYVDLEIPRDGDAEIGKIVSVRSSVIIDINWSNVARIIQSSVAYTVRIPFPDRTDTTTVRVLIPSGGAQLQSDGTWRMTILPANDIGVIFSKLLIRPGSDELFLDKIEAIVFVVSDAWESPTGDFDPELLVQPGTFSNVEGGFGFVGGGYYDTFTFEIEDDVARDAGFSNE